MKAMFREAITPTSGQAMLPFSLQVSEWRNSSDDGLTLEISPSQSFERGNFIFIILFDNNFLCFTFPPMRHRDFFRNYTLLF